MDNKPREALYKIKPLQWEVENDKTTHMSKRIIHCIATCSDCEKEWQDFRTARRLAAAHAKNTGHHVTGEVAHYFQYN